MEYTEFLQTLILATLLWIAIGLAVIARGILLLGRLLRFTPQRIKVLKKDHTPWVVKMMALKIVANMTIRYIGKKLK